MELTIALVISILSITFSIIGFALNRKDKSNNDVKNESYHLGQIDTKLKSIEIMLNKIENKLDTYDSEIDDRISIALEHHVNEYHRDK